MPNERKKSCKIQKQMADKGKFLLKIETNIPSMNVSFVLINSVITLVFQVFWEFYFISFNIFRLIKKKKKRTIVKNNKY
jgi:hypothetical protein